MTAMWSHYCPAEKTVIETGDGEPCNWCGSQSLNVEKTTAQRTKDIESAQKTFSDSVQALANAKPGKAIETFDNSVLPKIREAESKSGVRLLSDQQIENLRRQVQQLESISDKTEKARTAAKIIAGLTVGSAGVTAVGRTTGLFQ